MKPQSCSGCPLECHGHDFSQVEGLGRLGVLVCAEASGEQEAREGLPLRPHAPSGGIFERTLRRLGHSRDSFAVTNLIRCRPKDNLLDGMPFEADAIHHCEPNLLEAIAKFKPRVLLALGNLPLKYLAGISGEKRGVSYSRGYVFPALEQFSIAAGREPDLDPLLVLPTYHPSFLRRGAIHLTGVFARDLQRAVNVAAGRDRSYILEPPPSMPDWDDAEPDWDKCAAKAKRQMMDATDEWLARYNLNYILRPTRADLDAFCRDAKQRSDAWLALSPDMQAADLLALSWDLETYESASLDEDASDGFTDTQVRQFQASIEPRSGIAMEWRGEAIQAARWLLKLPLPKVGHNVYLFDQKVVRAVGERDFGDRTHFASSGTTHDTLQMFHQWQSDLPAHLQFASSFTQFELPWKHLNNENLSLYGVFDTDSALRLYRVMRRTMEDRKMWWDEQLDRQAAGYVAQVEAIRPILADMEDRGFPVDDARRIALDKDFEEAQAELMTELDAKFPDDARKVTPKGGYKGVPAAVKLLLEQIEPTASIVEDMVGSNGKPITKTARAKLVKESLEARWSNITDTEMAAIRATKFNDPPEKQDDGTEEPGDSYFFDVRQFGREDIGGGLLTPGYPAWCRVYQFSPNSPKQLLEYMKVRRHKIPTKKSGENTTGKVELQRLAAKHHDNFYLKVIECRELGKMRGTYIEGFKPHADGRVHTTFTFDTGTQQLSSRNPNTTNVPKHGRLAKAIRSMFRDPEGKLLVEWDFKSYHVLTTGFEAKSAEYMRLAKLDMHSFVAGHFNRDWDAGKLFAESDDELKARFKWFKADPARKHIRDKKAKPSILGIGFGLGVRKLYDMNRESFASLKEAQYLMDAIRALFPKVFRWQEEMRQLAHQQQYLRNRFGAIRWFYEVYAPDGHGGWKPGEQSEQAIAFLPASDAFGNIRETMKELERRRLNDKWRFSNTVHDSLLFFVEPDRLEEHQRDIYPVLHAPSKVLIDPVLAPGGLVVDAECSAGLSWAETEERELPKDLLQGYIEPCKLMPVIQPSIPTPAPPQGRLIHA